MSYCEAAIRRVCSVAHRTNRVHVHDAVKSGGDDGASGGAAAEPPTCAELSIFLLTFGWQSATVRHSLWWSRVDANIICGALPLRRHVRELTERENVRAVVTMNRKHEV